jgi:hypothetical protein
MKLLFVLLFIFPFSLSANESIICVSDNLQLNISVVDTTIPKSVAWTIKVIDNENVAISGSGVWQKEVESDDAFSSFDDNSAISYKNKRAVFVMGNDQSVYFPACKI